MEFEEENKKKKKLLERMCNFPYVLDKQNKRAHSKVNIRRNLSISQSAFTRKRSSTKNLSHNPSNSQMMNTTTIENVKSDKEENAPKPLRDDSAVREVDEGAEMETPQDAKLHRNETLGSNLEENRSSAHNNSIVVSFMLIYDSNEILLIFKIILVLTGESKPKVPFKET